MAWNGNIPEENKTPDGEISPNAISTNDAKDEISSVLNLTDADIIEARVEYFGDHGYAFNQCIIKYMQLPKIYRNAVTHDTVFPSPKDKDIVDHIRAYAQWNAWKALENVITYLWTKQPRLKKIDINDPSTMPSNKVVREVLSNNDPIIEDMIKVQYNEYYNLAWKYLLPTEKWAHSLAEFKALMKSVYNRYPEND